MTWTAFAILAMFQLVIITYNQRFKGAVYQLRENFEMKLSRCNTKGTDIEHLGDDNGQKWNKLPFWIPSKRERRWRLDGAQRRKQLIWYIFQNSIWIYVCSYNQKYKFWIALAIWHSWKSGSRIPSGFASIELKPTSFPQRIAGNENAFSEKTLNTIQRKRWAPLRPTWDV